MDGSMVYRLAFSRLLQRRSALLNRGLTDEEISALEREFEMLPEHIIAGLAEDNGNQLSAVVDDDPSDDAPRYTWFGLIMQLGFVALVSGFAASNFEEIGDRYAAAAWILTGFVLCLTVIPAQHRAHQTRQRAATRSGSGGMAWATAAPSLEPR